MSDGRIIVADAFKHLDPNQSLAEGIGSGFSRIGIKGKNWSLFHQGEKYLFVRDDDGTPLPYLDVIIVGVNPKISKMYWDGEYQDDSQEAPTCSAIDVNNGPDPGVPEPQATSCGVCKHNEWLPNRQGKECQDHKRVAVLLLPYMKTKPAMEAPLLEPVFFKVPPASLKPWKAYADSLNHRGAHFATVVTRITFEPGKLFQMNFTFKQPLTNAEAPLVLPMLEDSQTRNLIGTIPVVREIGPAVVPKEEAQETGLMAAFGKTGTVTNLPTTKRGRPAKSKNVEAQEGSVEAAPEQQQATNGADNGEAVEESDSDLDSAVKNVLSKKLSDMLK
jgi:hypothetical protein